MWNSTTEKLRENATPGVPPAKGFHLMLARYGGGDAWVDVTRQGRQHVVENRIRFSTNNLPEPIIGVVKALLMVYSLDGKIGVSIIPEQNREIERPSSDPAAFKLAEVPGEGFALLCAHYGACEKTDRCNGDVESPYQGWNA
jgi:hypothetical protein